MNAQTEGHVMNIETARAERFKGTVAIFFTTHYQAEKRDWETIEEVNGPYHPAAGYYRSDNPEIVKCQLHEMRRAGIDLIVYDAYGTYSMCPTDLATDRALKVLVDELSHQEHEPRKLKLVIYIEKYDSVPTREEYESALNFTRHNLAKCDFYFQYKGKPLVLLYLNGYPQCLDDVEWSNNDFTFKRIRPFGDIDVWAYVSSYPQKLRRDWMPVSPGMDSAME
ncbi:MAG: hypothetical protein WCN95_13965, partial [bacterium]